MTRVRLSRPLSARIETGPRSDIQASDVIERLLESFPRQAIECVQSLFGGKFMVTFADEGDKAEFVLQEHIRLRGNSFQILDADTHFRYVKIRNWPYEITPNEVRSLLGPFGNITEVRRDSHLDSGIPNGDITVLMNITTPIPSYLWFCGNQGYIHYRDQQRTCRQCGSTEHFARECPTCLNCRNRGHNTEDCLLSSRHESSDRMSSPEFPSITSPIQHGLRYPTDPDLTYHEDPEPSQEDEHVPFQEETEDRPEPTQEASTSDTEEVEIATTDVERNTDAMMDASESDTPDIELTHTVAVLEESHPRPTNVRPLKRIATEHPRVPEEEFHRMSMADKMKLIKTWEINKRKRLKKEKEQEDEKESLKHT